LVPIEGHSKVSERVVVRARRPATTFAHLNLHLDAEPKLRSRDRKKLQPPHERPGFICEDISNGVEHVRAARACTPFMFALGVFVKLP
jgi:hypothetical protein